MEKTPTPSTSGPVFRPDVLHRALMDLEDIMDRALCPYILTLETARCVKEGCSMEGDKITAVVKFNEATKQKRSTFRSYAHVLISDEGFGYEFGGVPIKVTFIKKKYNFFEHPDSKVYMAGFYLLPNPWETYWKSRFLITNKTRSK